VTRRRVSGATSSRPLTTFDAVGTETPAARATTASVGPATLPVRTMRARLPGPPEGPSKVSNSTARTTGIATA
jgi:hypothetical protein